MFPATQISSGRSMKGATLRVVSDQSRREAPEGAGRLALVLPLLAFEDDLLASVDVGNPLRLALAEFRLASVHVDFGPVADAEVDIVEGLGHSLEVILGCGVAGPQVEVDDDARGELGAFDVDENDVFLADLDGLLGKLHILNLAGIEVKGCDIVHIGHLREIDISHDGLKLKS